ncbi:MAG: SpaA isopeptide-forming pilin-related protein [Eubacterium sp.]
MTGKIKAFTRCVIFLSILTVFFAGTAMYSAALEVPDLSRKGTLILDVRDSVTDEPVPGGEFSVYKVADIKESGVNYVYEYTEAFDGKTDVPITTGVDLTPGLAAELRDVAFDEDVEPVYTTTIDSDGVVRFDEVDPGLYLVVETTAPDKYNLMDPFLVSIPLKQDDGTYLYEVSTYPKQGTYSDPPTNPPVTPPVTPPDEPELPNTGQLWWPVPILLGAGAVLIAAGIVILKKAKKEKE